MPRVARPDLIEERFLCRVDKHGPLATLRPDLGPCWVWQGGTIRGGYGAFWVGQTNVVAHRWYFEFINGPIPPLSNGDRQVLDHFACERPACVNPAHVRPVSVRENTLRGNAPSAWNLGKTHCPHGHEYTPENTFIRKRSRRRECRECMRQRARRQYVAARA